MNIENASFATEAFLSPSETRTEFTGKFAEDVDFVMKHQLLRRDLWARFVEQYRIKSDWDMGWRGEFWGKMMRGGCLVYRTTRDKELYAVLEETVRDMMTAREPSGRISTYPEENQFKAWDLWSRKYVLLGMSYFIEICEDEALIRDIVSCMKGQVDYLAERIGRGKLRITKLTRNWRGLNSSSILEPVVRLYNLTGEEKYLDFAQYIADEGGTDVENVFRLAYEDKLAPYQYPTTKAYEMTSCFEGLLDLYEVTGKAEYRDSVVRFAKRVLATDFTVIGSAGCTHELFDHSSARQASTKHGPIMQETCVTVTLMKFFYRCLRVTGDPVFADAFERAYYNGYLGSFNTEGNIDRIIRTLPNYAETLPEDGIRLVEKGVEIPREPMPFDSYSPLAAGIRGNGMGGLKFFDDGKYYGCCACIASAGIGLVGPMAVMNAPEGPVVNLYFPGKVETRTPAGQTLALNFETRYPLSGVVKVTVSLPEPEEMTLRFRVPGWCDRRATLCVNGERVESAPGYAEIRRVFADGDDVLLEMPMGVTAQRPESYGHDILMNKVVWDADMCVPVYDEEDPLQARHAALTYGPLLLAQDVRLGWDPEVPVPLTLGEDGRLDARFESTEGLPYKAQIAVSVGLADGRRMLLTDYASAGRLWSRDSRMAAWILTEE